MKLSTMSVTALSLLTAIYCNVTAAEQLPELKQVAATVPLKNSDDQSLNQIKLAIPQESLTDLRLKQQVTFSVDAGAPFPITFNDLVVNPGKTKTTTVPFNQQGTATLSVYSLAGVDGVGKYTISVPVTKMVIISATKVTTYKCSSGTLSGTNCIVTTYTNESPVDVYNMDQFICSGMSGYSVSADGSSGVCSYKKQVGSKEGPVTSERVISAKNPGNMTCSGPDALSITFTYLRPVPASDNASMAANGYSYYQRTDRSCIPVYDTKTGGGTYKTYTENAPACPSGSTCSNGHNRKYSHSYCPSGTTSSGSSCLRPSSTSVAATKIDDFVCPQDYTLTTYNQTPSCKG